MIFTDPIQAFDTLLHNACLQAGIATPAKYVAAVSGGSDSMALLSAAKHFHSVTIHYHLRPQADAEVAYVQHRAAQWHIPHSVVHAPIGHGNALQQRARTVRYNILQQAVVNAGADAVLIGHTAHDVAETLLQRLHTQSHLLGLASITPASKVVWPCGRSLLVIRPWHSVWRHTLQHALQRRNIAWMTDASNATSVRGLWRARAEALAEHNLGWVRLYHTAQQAALHRHYGSVAAAALLQQYVVKITPQHAIIQPAAAQHPAFNILARFLLHRIGGAAYAPTLTQAAQTLGALCAGQRTPLPARCVGIIKRDGVHIRREQRRNAAPYNDPLFIVSCDFALEDAWQALHCSV